MKFELVVFVIVGALLFAGCASSGPSTAAPPANPASAPQTPPTQVQTPPAQPPAVQAPPKVITTCTDSDGTCPAGCNVFNDNDCKALAPGTQATSGDLKITVSNPEIQVCTSDYSEDKDTYLVFDVNVENTGKDTAYVSSMEFNAVNPNRKQFDGSLIAYPMAFSGNCKDAKNDAFSGGNLMPGSKDNGKIWIELSKTGSYEKGKWFIVHKKAISLKDIYTVYETQVN